MRKILSTTLLMTCIFACLILTNASLKRAERIECTKWQNDARLYPNFYFADWQAKQCNLSPEKLQKVLGEKYEIIYSPQK